MFSGLFLCLGLLDWCFWWLFCLWICVWRVVFVIWLVCIVYLFCCFDCLFFYMVIGCFSCCCYLLAVSWFGLVAVDCYVGDYCLCAYFVGLCLVYCWFVVALVAVFRLLLFVVA